MTDHDHQTDDAGRGLHPDKVTSVRFREAPVASFDDLTRGLLWPNLLRAPALALRPERVGLAFATLVLIGLIGSLAGVGSDRPGLAEAVTQAMGPGIERVLTGLLTGSIPAIIEGALETWIGPFGVLEDRPIVGVLLGVPMLAVLAIGVGAVGRSAARDYADSIREPWTVSLAFALSRGVSFFFALAGPAIAVAAIALVIACSGWLLLTLPGVSVVGAVLFGGTLLLGIIGGIVIVFGLLALPISGAALACEGTDAIDALQRAYAYAVARPIRLLVYIVIAKLVGLAFLALVGGILEIGQLLTLNASEAFGGRPIDTGGEGLWAASTGIVRFWLGLLQLLLAAIGMSYSVCASTLVYLQIRRVVDGQDPQDLWSPPAGNAGA